MNSRLGFITVLSLFAGIFMFVGITESCNEAVCASIVSKCMITQSCKCDLKHCSCCKECFNCLSHLYSECCSCVEMCPKPNNTLSPLSSKSHVEDLPGALPELFNSLTAEPDGNEQWTTVTFPIDINVSLYYPHLDKVIKHIQSTKNSEQEVDPIKDVLTLNCSVAYQTQCMPWNKCKGSCHAMGAVSYRWFHDGCCECIGEYCINYGINESRCKCPELDDKLLDPEADLDYGEEEED